jgi:hypothetical protein
MSDEPVTDPERADAELSDVMPPGPDEPASAGDTGDGGDDTGDEGEQGLDDSTPEVTVDPVRDALEKLLANREVVGQLTLHYPERDVDFVLDGDTAMRVLMMFENPTRRDLMDKLSRLSDASNCWLVADLRSPLAVTWLPGVPNPNRTTVDPEPYRR